MRKFFLEADGVRYGLNREAGYFLTNVTGLGVASETSYEAVNKDGFYLATDRTQSQAQVVGDLIFCGSAPYTEYKAFADSVLTAEKLLLVYDNAGTEYRAECDISYLTKTEQTAQGLLQCPVAFMLKSLWYTEEILTGTGVVAISAGGQYETAVKVKVNAALTNPVLTITEGTNVIAKAVLSVSTAAPFEYSNFPSDSHITDGTGDIVKYVDVTNTVFGRTRKAFTVSINGANMTVTARRYWRTV